MKLTVHRRFLGENYTIGSLYIDGERFTYNGHAVDTLEDTNRDKNRNGQFDNGEKKVYGKTCIPFGIYRISMDYSPKFSQRIAYKNFIVAGRMPHILDVPEFTGILIHGGNTPNDTLGCLLVGFNTIKGQLTQSLACFSALYARLWAAVTSGQKITIEFTTEKPV